MTKNTKMGLGLIFLGLLVNNFSFLYDVLLNTSDGWIFLGWKAQLGVAVGALAVLVGLGLICRGARKAG
ncbi:MAG: hypothetical protein AB1781_04610 [Pseudomonadota bacterium]